MTWWVWTVNTCEATVFCQVLPTRQGLLEEGHEPISRSLARLKQRYCLASNATLRESQRCRPILPPRVLLTHSSGNSVGCPMGDSEASCLLVNSCPVSASFQDLPNMLSPVGAILRLRCPFKIATFQLQAPMHTEQPGCSAITFETIAIDECFFLHSQ